MVVPMDSMERTFSEFSTNIFGIVKITLTASGAAKLDHATDTNICKAINGKQAIHPPITLVKIVPQGISAG